MKLIDAEHLDRISLDAAAIDCVVDTLHPILMEDDSDVHPDAFARPLLRVHRSDSCVGSGDDEARAGVCFCLGAPPFILVVAVSLGCAAAVVGLVLLGLL